MTDYDSLRSRLSDVAEDLAKDFPSQMLARAFVAAGCDVALSTDGGMSAAIRITEGATNLLAGHWSQEPIRCFIETKY